MLNVLTKHGYNIGLLARVSLSLDRFWIKNFFWRIAYFLGEQKSWNSSHRHRTLSMSYMYTVYCVLLVNTP